MKRFRWTTLLLSMSLLLPSAPEIAQADANLHIYRNESGQIHTITGYLGRFQGDSESARALHALQLVQDTYRFTDPNRQFSYENSHLDEYGLRHQRLHQRLNNIPIFGRDVLLHEMDDALVGVSGFCEPLTPNSDMPTVKAEEAIDAAQEAVQNPTPSEDLSADLVYYPTGDQANLAYLVRVNWLGDEPGRWTVLVDALDGSILAKINNIETSDKSVQTTMRSGIYYLIDESRPMFEQFGSSIRTYTFQIGTQSQAQLTDLDNIWDSPEQSAAVDAHLHAGRIYDYYLQHFKRNSFDGLGSPMRSAVQFGHNYANAFWDGAQVIYGDGDDQIPTPLSAALDICAHEWTHAVIDTSAGLLYTGQSGALAESFADALASVIEGRDWTLGEDLFPVGSKQTALRSLAEPAAYGQPEHMRDYRTVEEDNGGVHLNAGIPNRAFYNFATRIHSREQAGQVWYLALRDYLTPDADFSAARAATEQACAVLYGPNSQIAHDLATAWLSVGVE
ncbi:M4 family metallopeptidase [Tumebacillus permanentifrigoris]|uniref:Neutral metalloproteinase n=1 Tax=Tumebacillus permanentifrigoris TaxID=378543 RepID=A0A316DDQ8_9BACL|nr:M4 family metallopeptidase [Tumebacillus permanentifrigoris]PWK16367.1 thermolysin [Tumebacillus permanentifrigoris]